MKKFVSVLCTGAMVLTFGSAAFANPSLSTAGIESAAVDEATAAKVPDGYQIAIQDEFDDEALALIADERVAEVISRLNSNEKKLTMEEMLDILEIELSEDGTVETTDGNEIDPLDYAPIVKFAAIDLVEDATGEETYGEDLDLDLDEIEVDLTMEALKDTQAQDLLFMQLNPDTAAASFIEIAEEDLDAEEGTVTVAFPGFGPFLTLEKTAE